MPQFPFSEDVPIIPWSQVGSYAPAVLAYEGISLTSRVIRRWSYGEFSHVSRLTCAKLEIEAWTKGGVRPAHVPGSLHKPGTKVCIYRVVGIDDQQEEKVDASCASYIGRKYDWTGVLLGFALRSGVWQSEARMFCSELVATAFWLADFPLLNAPPHAINPTALTWSPRLKCVARSEVA